MEGNFSDINWLNENKEDIRNFLHTHTRYVEVFEVLELLEKLNKEWLKENEDILEKIVAICAPRIDTPELVEKLGKECLSGNPYIINSLVRMCRDERILELVEKLDKEWLKEDKDIIEGIVIRCRIFDNIPGLAKKLGKDFLKENIDIVNQLLDSCSDYYIPKLVSELDKEWLKENKDIIEKAIDNCYKAYIPDLVRELDKEWLKENKDIIEKAIDKCQKEDIHDLVQKLDKEWLKENKDIVEKAIDNCYDAYIPDLVQKLDNEWLKENKDIIEKAIDNCYKAYIPNLVRELGKEWLKENRDIVEKVVEQCDMSRIYALVSELDKEKLKENKDIIEKAIDNCHKDYIPKLVSELDGEWLKENRDIIEKAIDNCYKASISDLVQKLDKEWLKENKDIVEKAIDNCYEAYIPDLVQKLDKEWLKENRDIVEKAVDLCYVSRIPDLVRELDKEWLKENKDIIEKLVEQCDVGYIHGLVKQLDKEWLKENKDVVKNVVDKVVDNHKELIPNLVVSLEKDYLRNDFDLFKSLLYIYKENCSEIEYKQKILELGDNLKTNELEDYKIIEFLLKESEFNINIEDVKLVLQNKRGNIVEKMWKGEILIPSYIKFKKLHNFVPSDEVLIKYPIDKIEKFNKKTWFSVAKHNIFQQSLEAKNSLVEMSQLFGVFENDNEVQNRIKKIHEIATYLPKEISWDEIHDASVLDFEEIDEDMYIIKIPNYKYVTDIIRYKRVLDLDDIDLTDELTNGTRAENIESELKFVKERLRDSITESEYQNLKKIAERNVLLRKVLDKMYEKQEVSGFRLENIPLNEKEINELQEKLERAGVNDVITANKIHNMFDGSSMEYNPQLYKFIEENLEEIIKNPMITGKLSSISREWNNIQKTYGVKELTIEHCLRYYDDIEYENVGEYYELARVCKQNGVSQSDFEELKEIYAIQKIRKANSIPEQNVGKKKEVRGVTLRLDDPRALVIGMPLMTNCCQSLHDAGEACMRHSATSKDGRVFVVLDEEDNILMQSWMWMSKDGKTICYDNPESSIYYDNHRKEYEEKVVEVYKKHAESLIKKQNERIEKEKQEKLKEASLVEKKKIEEQYDSLKVEQVTMGVGYADAIDLEGYFNVITQDEDVKPNKYDGYRDSHTQVLIAGKEVVEREKIVTSEEREKIQQVFEDKSIVARKTGYEIDKKDISNIKEIEKNVHKQSMVEYEEVNDVEDLAYLYNELEEDMKVRYGKSWYTVYADRENGIHIYDLAKEKDADMSADIEMMEELGCIIAEAIGEDGKARQIEAELREDTSYRLYLKLLQSGLVEQIGNDVLYTYEEDGYEVEEGRNFTKEEQQKILNDKKGKDLQEKTKNTNMHRIVFKPTEEYLKSKLYKSMQEKRKKEAEYGWELS